MAKTRESQTLGIRIERNAAAVAAYLAQPLNFNQWASGLGNSLREHGGRWCGEGPGGAFELRFSPPNDFGIADHWVVLADDMVVYVPMRTIANGDGAEVVFTLIRQPGMTDAQFEADANWVRKDLASLKQILETGA
jgi:hypothetical protein